MDGGLIIVCHFGVSSIWVPLNRIWKYFFFHAFSNKINLIIEDEIDFDLYHQVSFGSAARVIKKA